MKAEIREYIYMNVGDAGIEDSQPLFTSGLLDSFGVLELIDFLEEKFGIAIDTATYEFKQFDTIEKIENLVAEIKSKTAQN